MEILKGNIEKGKSKCTFDNNSKLIGIISKIEDKYAYVIV